MENKTSKYAFGVSIVALLLALSIIFVIIMDVWAISVIDSDSFISGLVALMSLVFALLVGYQIYNAVDAREKMDSMRNEMEVKLKEIDSLKNELQVTMSELKEDVVSTQSEVKGLTNEFEEGGYILQARIAAKTPKHHYIAFLKMMAAVRVALNVDHKNDGYSWMINELKEYMLLINNGYPFDGSSNDIPLKVQQYRDSFRDEDDAIRKHPDFYIIRDSYTPLMDEFDIRLDGIAHMKTMSFTEVGKELKVE